MVLTTVVILAVIALADVYTAVLYASTRQSAEDSRTQGYVVVTARSHLHAASDPLPADISEADYAAFWNEPALNTPDTLALLDVLNESSAKGLRNSTDHLGSKAQTIRDPGKRANAQAAVDELAELLMHGTVQQAKRMVYEDLTGLVQQTCLPDTVQSFPSVSADQLISNWRAATPANNVLLSWAAKDTGPVGRMVDQVYPGALEAALPRACPFPPPPVSTHPKDAGLLANVVWDASHMLDAVKAHPNARGTLSAEHYEAFWNSPVMTSPEAEFYLDRMGATIVDGYRESIRGQRERANGIVDDDVREYALQRLDFALSEAEADDGRQRAVGIMYRDFERYWADTCVHPEDSSWSVKRNPWTSRLEPKFRLPYVEAIWTTRVKGNETSIELAREFYPEAYEAGLENYCTHKASAT